MIVDTHAHLSDPRLAEDLEHWLEEARAAGVMRIVNVGADLASSRLAVEQAKRHSGLFAAVGIHPHDAKTWSSELEEELLNLCREPEVCAFGEIGLDYYYDHSPREVQRKVFLRQLELAKEENLPVIIHDRDAHEDVLGLLREAAPFPAGGVMHCYSGSAEMVPQFLALGFYISFAGPVTFKNAKKPVAAALQVPVDRLLAETDSPYLSPHPYRGKVNHPARTAVVLDRLAALRGEEVSFLQEQTTANAERLFGLTKARL